MANNVSDLGVKLSTDPQQFIKGFEAARASVQPLAGAISNLNTALTSFNIGGFAGRFAQIAAPLQTLAANLASRNFAGAAVDGVNLAAAFSQMGSEALRTAASQIRMADQLGMTQTGFQGLTVLAQRFNLDMDQVNHGVSKFNSHIGDLRSGLARGEVPPLAVALRRLGIDARNFVELRTDQQLFEIARAMERIPNMQDRRFALSQIFGERESFTFQQMFSRGSQEILRAENDALERGLVLYGERREQVERAARAQREFSAQLELTQNAIGREIGVQTAPFVEMATNSLRPNTLENTFLQGFFNPFGIFDTADISNAESVRRTRELRENQQRMGGDLNARVEENRGNRWLRLAEDQRNTLDRQTNIEAEVLLDTLRRQGQAIGYSAAEAEILRRNLDEMNPPLADQLRLQERINTQRQQQVTQAQQIREQFNAARPMLNFQLEMQRLRNNPQLTREQRQFGAFQAIQNLESTVGRIETRYTGAMGVGSAEAVSAITQARAQQMDNEMAPQDRLAMLFERATKSQERVERLMERFFDGLGRYGISVAPEN